MKFINVIREGDFVRLKTLSQLEKEFGKPQKGVVIGSLFFGDTANLDYLDSSFFVYKNVKEELGNVLRIKKIKNSVVSDSILFHAENNGISYDNAEDYDVTFEEQIVDAVLINGKWHQADTDLNVLL